MPFDKVSRAFNLSDISPVAKLIAIKIGDIPEGATHSIEKLARFACCDLETAEPGISELESIGFKVARLGGGFYIFGWPE